jgi:ATP-dependent DNA helicase RecG
VGGADLKTLPHIVPSDSPLKAAITEAEHLANGPFANYTVGLLHGRMTAEQKQITMARFQRNEIKVLVATTVVEVGIDIPNATAMVIHHARRFGLAQLHQLRGRIGRSQKPSTCYLIDENITPPLPADVSSNVAPTFVGGAERYTRSTTNKPCSGRRPGRPSSIAESVNNPANHTTPDRLQILASTTDGFQIAEADLAQRGPGEILGTRQHGTPLEKIAHLIDNLDLLNQANEDAMELLKTDPTLSSKESKPLKDSLTNRYPPSTGGPSL